MQSIIQKTTPFAHKALKAYLDGRWRYITSGVTSGYTAHRAGIDYRQFREAYPDIFIHESPYERSKDILFHTTSAAAFGMFMGAVPEITCILMLIV